MKKGFTLAELLIVLGITGVVAATLLPLVNNLMPDKTKIAYLKAHDELKTAIQSLASNSSLYPICLEQGDTTIGCQEHPLINTSKPLIKKFESYTGDTKLCKLLAFSMDAQESCQEGNYAYSDTTFTQNLSFTTKNGMQWKIVPQTRTIESDKATYQSDVYVDVDPSKKSKNCMYSPTCKHPDRFKFLVAADGSVIPADPHGLMYLNTRKSFTKNKNEKTEGDVQTLLVSNLREFEFKPCTEGSGAIPNCEPGMVWDPTANACVPEEDNGDACSKVQPFYNYGGCNSADDLNTTACLRHMYSELGKTFSESSEKYGNPTNWGLVNISNYATLKDYQGSLALYNKLGGNFKLAKDCKNGTGCFADTYPKREDGAVWTDNINRGQHRYKIITEDGMAVAFQGYSQNCDRMHNSLTFCGIVYVDIDGPDKGDFTLGRDLFQFLITKDGVLAADPANTDCFKFGGWCTQHVIDKCNREYWQH